jgi:DNA-directed RNA polymerase subunit RPC12/RpoP
MEAGITIFERSCGYCGARFRVVASHRPEVHGHHEDYECPECGKRYEAEAVDPPEVLLLKPRTDGKHDRYQETMF